MAAQDPEAAFAEIAAALYALPPGRFTTERNARAKAARADGDRDLAARITALPKASASAWLVDLLAREGADDLDRVLRLGGELRHAQQQADRDRLRALTTERRELLAEVADRTVSRAEEAGQRASATVLEEFQQTLQAAMVDDGAAEAVRTARLTRALTADGLDPVDTTNAVGGPGHLPAPRRSPRRSAAPATSDDDHEAAAARHARVQEARQRQADAEQRARQAGDTAEQAAARASDADQQAEDRARAADGLRARLADLQHDLQDAEAAADDAEQAATDARAAAERASRAAEDARNEADEATSLLQELQED